LSPCGPPHPIAPLPELTARLRREARRVTGPREAILDVLRRHARPLRIKEIHTLLGAGANCDLATVYRAMPLLEGMGMVKRVELGRRGSSFELLGEGDDGHHHHLVCTECDRVMELDSCLLETVEKGISLASGFKKVTHRLEFFGICPRCQSPAS